MILLREKVTREKAIYHKGHWRNNGPPQRTMAIMFDKKFHSLFVLRWQYKQIGDSKTTKMSKAIDSSYGRQIKWASTIRIKKFYYD